MELLLDYECYYHNGTHKSNCVLVISSREFRQNQRMYFDKADEGEQIFVQRGKDKSYALNPIRKQDMYFNEGMVKRIKESVKQASNGEYIEISSSEEIKELLGL